MGKLKEFKRKCLEFIDSETMKKYLNEREDVRFSLRELLSIVYNSKREISQKVIFYRELENNFELNDEERKDIKKLIINESLPNEMYLINYDEIIKFKEYLENLYIDIPSPFRLGDIVRDIEDNSEWVVINPELPNGTKEELCDKFDMCILAITVEYKNFATEKYFKERKQKYEKIAKESSIQIEELDEITRYHKHLMILNLELIKCEV